MLAISPASHIMMNSIERPSALLRRKFSIICGEKTTTQHAVESYYLRYDRARTQGHWFAVRTDRYGARDATYG